jgi:hypothetical protein
MLLSVNQAAFLEKDLVAVEQCKCSLCNNPEDNRVVVAVLRDNTRIDLEMPYEDAVAWFRRAKGLPRDD